MRILRVAELVECPVGCRSVLEPATFSCKYRIGEYPESLWNRCVIIFSTLHAPFPCSGGAALPAGASRPMAQPVVQPPVAYVSLVSNYPSPRAKRERKPLSEVLTPNQPAVLHLFTG